MSESSIYNILTYLEWGVEFYSQKFGLFIAKNLHFGQGCNSIHNFLQYSNKKYANIWRK